MKSKFFTIILISSIVWASAGYDNGTSTGRGKFKIDITWNPFKKFDFGQSYIVMSYGFTENFDFHGYISKHPEGFYTYYYGLFYQFFDSDKLDLATAIGARKNLQDKKINHLFLPQLLFTRKVTQNLSFGGSIVGVSDYSTKINTALDIGATYKLKYKSNAIESISLSFGGFHPATWQPSSFFLPTYSIDIKFN